VSAKSWAVVALAVVALGAAIGLAVAASLEFLLIGVAVVVALSATYFAGRLDKPGGEG
jgi:hypothetical protein